MSQPHAALAVDHVTIAGPDLAALEAAFARTGLPFVYGGPHSNGVTHMALSSFEDGSYVELIATLEPGAEAPIWSRHIAGGGGPCAWAVGAPAPGGVAAEAARLAGLGVPVRGPFAMHRRRPDGRVAEWDLAYVGAGDPGATLPFVIEDRTPRELRVPPPEPGAAGGRITGVAAVILSVPDLEGAVALFRSVYDLPEPIVREDGRLARFDRTPVVLAAASEGRLADRLARFGPSPCGFLFATDDAAAASRRLGLPLPDSWLDLQVAWFDEARIGGAWLGITPSHSGQP
jgi:hypothetical protein